jgi:hypothetical protein
LAGRREVAVAAGDVEGADVTLGAGGAITGTIKLEGLNNVAWPSVTVAMLDGTARATMKVEANGTFKVPPNPPSGEWEVRVTGLPPGAYVKSIRYEGQEARHGRIDLAGGGSGSIDIVLSAGAAAVSGKVVNSGGEAAPAVRVIVWPAKPDAGGGIKSANTDQRGEYEIGELGPGEYSIAAWEGIPDALADDATFLARFQSAAATVTLAEGTRAGMELKLIPQDRVDSEMAKQQ